MLFHTIVSSLKHHLSSRRRTLLSDLHFNVILFLTWMETYSTRVPPQKAYLFLSSHIFFIYKIHEYCFSFNHTSIWREKNHPVVTTKSSIKNLEFLKNRRIGKYIRTLVRNNFVWFTRSLLGLYLNVVMCPWSHLSDLENFQIIKMSQS